MTVQDPDLGLVVTGCFATSRKGVLELDITDVVGRVCVFSLSCRECGARVETRSEKVIT